MNIRKEANNIVCRVFVKKNYSDKLLNQTVKKIKNSQRDKNLLYSLVKGTIKMYKTLEYTALQFVDPIKFKKTPIKVKLLLYMGFYQLIYLDNLPNFAVVNETVELARELFDERTSKFINAVLREYLRRSEIDFPDDEAEFLSYYYSFDAEMIKTWISLWGFENTEKMCEYFNSPSKYYFRINSYLNDEDELFSYFKKKNIAFKEVENIYNFFSADKPSLLLKDIIFGDGYFSVQDPAAGLVSILLDPQKEESLLDLFAAPGGKTTHIAEIMKNSGEIVAVDKFPHKTKLLKANARRLNLKNIMVVTGDAFNYGPVAPAFDKVLIDVPCSGWGNFQKKPELRWQINQNMKQLIKLQESALEKAALFVKKGGYLVYSTCTLNPLENENQVERFLKKHRNFKLVPASLFIDKKFTEKDYLKVIPFKHNFDGAFGAKLQRIK